LGEAPPSLCEWEVAAYFSKVYNVIFWRTRDEAMIAPQVAHSACDLEPESIQMIKLQQWVSRGYETQ
jgi:hypothetical protein